MKAREQHIVPLSRQALEILRELQAAQAGREVAHSSNIAATAATYATVRRENESFVASVVTVAGRSRAGSSLVRECTRPHPYFTATVSTVNSRPPPKRSSSWAVTN